MRLTDFISCWKDLFSISIKDNHILLWTIRAKVFVKILVGMKRPKGRPYFGNNPTLFPILDIIHCNNLIASCRSKDVILSPFWSNGITHWGHLLHVSFLIKRVKFSVSKAAFHPLSFSATRNNCHRALYPEKLILTSSFTFEMQTWLTLLKVATEEEGKKVQKVAIPKNPRSFHLFQMTDNLIWLKNMAVCSPEVTGLRYTGFLLMKGTILCAYPMWLHKVCLTLRAALLLYPFLVSSSN